MSENGRLRRFRKTSCDHNMVKPAVRLSTLLLVLGIAQLSAAEDVDCAQIENARDRLACFDARYPRDPDKPNIIPAPRAPVDQAGPTAPRRELEPARNVNEDPPFRTSQGIFDAPVDVDFTATIAAVRSRDAQRMVFRLDNEQIWMQSTPRRLPIREGDQVTIKSATVGGYIMRTENGTSTRVQRIK